MVFILSFSLVGCLRSHQASLRQGISAQDIHDLKADCGELSQLGQFSNLRSAIRSDANQVLQLTSQPNVLIHLPLIERLTDAIDTNVQALTAMLGAPWNIPKWNHEIIWKIPLEGENHDGPIFVHVEKVIQNGKVERKLTQQVRIRIVDGFVIVRLPKESTSLEICDLLKHTFGIYLKITYGSVIQVSTHHRLTIKNERL